MSTHHRARHHRTGADAGSASLELVLATPLLILMLMLIVQAGLWLHAGHIAQAAATRALDATRVQGGSITTGQHAAADTLHAVAGTTLSHVHVTITRTATRARVEITATATPVLPGIEWPVHAVATGPTERYVPQPAVGTARNGR